MIEEKRMTKESVTLRNSLRQHLVIVVSLLFFICAPLSAKMLCEIGGEAESTLKLIKGKWLVRETGYIFSFTDRFVRKLYGLGYYYYDSSVNSKNKIYLFTIVKSKKTGRLYFARGEYRNGEFYSSTSRIRFSGKNHLTVYCSDNPRQVLYEAVRVLRKKRETGS